jgi:hypothetical protein
MANQEVFTEQPSDEHRVHTTHHNDVVVSGQNSTIFLVFFI